MAVDPWHRRLLGRILAVAVRALSWTVRCRVEGLDAVEDLRRRGERLVFSFWHGRQFLMLRPNEGQRGLIMVSLSGDGTLQKEVLEHFGYETVRGSASRGGRAALRAMTRRLVEESIQCGLAVDGPRGPREQVKGGAVLLAARAGAYLVPMSAAVRRRWRLGSWDRMEIPWPFTTGWIVYGEPFEVEVTRGGRSRARRRLQRAMDRVTRRAEELAGCR